MTIGRKSSLIVDVSHVLDLATLEPKVISTDHLTAGQIIVSNRSTGSIGCITPPNDGGFIALNDDVQGRHLEGAIAVADRSNCPSQHVNALEMQSELLVPDDIVAEQGQITVPVAAIDAVIVRVDHFPGSRHHSSFRSRLEIDSVITPPT